MRDSRDYSATMRDSRDYSATMQDSQDYSATMQDSRDYSATMQDSLDYSATMQDSLDYSATMRDSLDYNVTMRDSRQHMSNSLKKGESRTTVPQAKPLRSLQDEFGCPENLPDSQQGRHDVQSPEWPRGHLPTPKHPHTHPETNLRSAWQLLMRCPICDQRPTHSPFPPPSLYNTIPPTTPTTPGLGNHHQRLGNRSITIPKLALCVCVNVSVSL